jgi:HK97 family phage major capsid protein
MNRYERRRKAIDEAIREQITEYKSIYAHADKEDRDPTDEERLDVESHLKAIETLKAERSEVEANIKTIEHVEEIGKSLGPVIPTEGEAGGVRFEENVQVGAHRPTQHLIKSLGEQFTESKGYKDGVARLKEGGLGQNWKSGMIEAQFKAGTLTEAATLGAGLIPVPQVIPGVVSTLFQRLTVEDLLMQGQATTNSIRYIVEGTATSGATGVAEGGVKPASALGLSTKDEPVKKIATSLVVTDEMLEDVDQVQSYINGRLTLFVQNQTETSLLSGAGTNDLVGLLNGARGINSLGVSGTDNGGDTLFKAINGIRGSAFLEPDAILISPSSWQKIRLLRDAAGGTAGQYMGGGPFQIGPYGGPQGPAGVSNQVQGPNDYLWNKPVFVTSALSAGSALVITRAGAQVYSRGGLNVEASNAGYVGGADLFTQNLVAIRAERRLALCVYRPAAFALVTGI